jgi:hypothetical protein
VHGLAGINYPLRACVGGIVVWVTAGGWTDTVHGTLCAGGEKHTTWAGGYRVAAFVSGGVIPPSLRGTTSNLRLSIVDW